MSTVRCSGLSTSAMGSDRLWARTFVVTDVAGDHDSKSQESTGGDFGAPLCSLLSDSIKWLFEQPSGFEHEVQDRYRVA